MSTQENFAVLAVVAIFILIGFIFGTMWGEYCAAERIRRQAVAADVAYWSINPTNGATTFTWGSR